MVHYELIGSQLVCLFRRWASAAPREQSHHGGWSILAS